MTSEEERVRQLAERIARRVTEPNQPAADGASGDDMAEVRRSLNELKQRLTQIESHLVPERAVGGSRQSRQDNGQAQSEERAPATGSPWLSGMYVPAAHPSQEKFGVEEATVSELVDFFEGAKRCELEPGGKPCDHCDMCSSRGF